MRKRDILMSVRLAEDEAERFRAYAELCGLSQSALIRMLIRGLLPQPNPPETFWVMINELYIIYDSFRIIAESKVEVSGHAHQEQKQTANFILQLQTAVTLPGKAVGLYGGN